MDPRSWSFLPEFMLCLQSLYCADFLKYLGINFVYLFSNCACAHRPNHVLSIPHKTWKRHIDQTQSNKRHYQSDLSVITNAIWMWFVVPDQCSASFTCNKNKCGSMVRKFLGNLSRPDLRWPITLYHIKQETLLLV